MHGNDRMEEIMADIAEHLKPVISHGAGNNIHHYNRVWEKIDEWFKKHSSEQKEATPCPPQLSAPGNQRTVYATVMQPKDLGVSIPTISKYRSGALQITEKIKDLCAQITQRELKKKRLYCPAQQLDGAIRQHLHRLFEDYNGGVYYHASAVCDAEKGFNYVKP